MPSAHPVNAALLAIAITTGFVLTGAISAKTPPTALESSETMIDATGAEIAIRDYSRIVSTSTIADQVLARIIDPRRILAVSGHTLRMREPAILSDKIGVERARDIETIIELRPDIVFINNFVDRRHVERFKDAGLNVFDLGEMRGLETLPANIRDVAALVGAPEHGERLADTLLRELEQVAADIPQSERRRGLYVGIHGDRLYGGTVGTSFHDVIVAGGLIDVAAEAGFRNWPAYTNEQLLSLDPPWIITNSGTENALCRHPGLQSLSACRLGRVRSIETALLTDPGFRMLDAARAIREAVYTERR